MNRKKNDCLFYYGVAVPNLEETRKISNTNIILQDYNPLVHQGLYQEFFPNCQRFLYLNVSHLHINELPSYDLNLRDLKYNKEWETYLLNLEQENSFQIILSKALRLLKIEGVQGLFLDDVDFWGDRPELRTLFLKLISEIREKSSITNVQFILNRGPQFWHKIDGLEAIILENIYPEKIYTTVESDLSWYENLIRINFSLINLASPVVPIFGLRYPDSDDDVEFERDFDSEERRENIFKEMNKNITKTLKYKRNFTEWPTQLVL